MSEDVKDVLVDFANALESASVKLRMEIAPQSQNNKWNPDSLKWQKAYGSKGEFERCEDLDTPDFKAMLNDLATHGNKLTRQGFFYWKFSNNSTVGRKRKG